MDGGLELGPCDRRPGLARFDCCLIDACVLVGIDELTGVVPLGGSSASRASDRRRVPSVGGGGENESSASASSSSSSSSSAAAAAQIMHRAWPLNQPYSAKVLGVAADETDGHVTLRSTSATAEFRRRALSSSNNSNSNNSSGSPVTPTTTDPSQTSRSRQGSGASAQSHRSSSSSSSDGTSNASRAAAGSASSAASHASSSSSSASASASSSASSPPSSRKSPGRFTGDASFVNNLPLFCLPDGAYLLAAKDLAGHHRSRSHSFVITDDYGSRSYVACLTWYRRLDPGLLLHAEHANQPGLVAEETAANAANADNADNSATATGTHVAATSPGYQEACKSKTLQDLEHLFLSNGYTSADLSRLLAEGLYAPVTISLVSQFPYISVLRDSLCAMLPSVQLFSDDYIHVIDAYVSMLLHVPVPPQGALALRFTLPDARALLLTTSSLSALEQSNQAKSLSSVSSRGSFGTPASVGGTSFVANAGQAQDGESSLFAGYPITVKPLWLSRIPIVDVPIRQLFLCLSTDAIIQVLSCILLEQKMVFISSKPALLTNVTQVLLSLVLPFQWKHTYISVLPSFLLDYVEAPGTFIMGIHSRHRESIMNLVSGTVIVDLDQSSVSIPSSLALPALPRGAHRRLIYALSRVSLHYETDALEKPAFEAQRDFVRMERHYRKFEVNARVAFFEFIVQLFANVKNHLMFDKRVLNLESFLRGQPEESHAFYRRITETSMFSMFLQSRKRAMRDYFDERADDASYVASLATIPIPLPTQLPYPRSFERTRLSTLAPHDRFGLGLIGEPHHAPGTNFSNSNLLPDPRQLQGVSPPRSPPHLARGFSMQVVQSMPPPTPSPAFLDDYVERDPFVGAGGSSLSNNPHHPAIFRADSAPPNFGMNSEPTPGSASPASASNLVGSTSADRASQTAMLDWTLPLVFDMPPFGLRWVEQYLDPDASSSEGAESMFFVRCLERLCVSLSETHEAPGVLASPSGPLSAASSATRTPGSPSASASVLAPSSPSPSATSSKSAASADGDSALGRLSAWASSTRSLLSRHLFMPTSPSAASQHEPALAGGLGLSLSDGQLFSPRNRMSLVQMREEVAAVLQATPQSAGLPTATGPSARHVSYPLRTQSSSASIGSFSHPVESAGFVPLIYIRGLFAAAEGLTSQALADFDLVYRRDASLFPKVVVGTLFSYRESNLSSPASHSPLLQSSLNYIGGASVHGIPSHLCRLGRLCVDVTGGKLHSRRSMAVRSPASGLRATDSQLRAASPRRAMPNGRAGTDASTATSLALDLPSVIHSTKDVLDSLAKRDWLNCSTFVKCGVLLRLVTDVDTGERLFDVLCQDLPISERASTAAAPASASASVDTRPPSSHQAPQPAKSTNAPSVRNVTSSPASSSSPAHAPAPAHAPSPSFGNFLRGGNNARAREDRKSAGVAVSAATASPQTSSTATEEDDYDTLLDVPSSLFIGKVRPLSTAEFGGIDKLQQLIAAPRQSSDAANAPPSSASALRSPDKAVSKSDFKAFYELWTGVVQPIQLPELPADRLELGESIIKVSTLARTHDGIGLLILTTARIFILLDDKRVLKEITRIGNIDSVEKFQFKKLIPPGVPSVRIFHRSASAQANAPELTKTEVLILSGRDLWFDYIMEMVAAYKVAKGSKNPQAIQQAAINIALSETLEKMKKDLYHRLLFFSQTFPLYRSLPLSTIQALVLRIDTTPHDIRKATTECMAFREKKLWCGMSNGALLVFDSVTWALETELTLSGIPVQDKAGHSDSPQSTFLQQLPHPFPANRICSLLAVRRHMWAGSFDHLIHIVDARTRQTVTVLDRHHAAVCDLVSFVAQSATPSLPGSTSAGAMHGTSGPDSPVHHHHHRMASDTGSPVSLPTAIPARTSSNLSEVFAASARNDAQLYEYVVSCSLDGHVVCWDLNSRECLVEAHIFAAASELLQEKIEQRLMDSQIYATPLRAMQRVLSTTSTSMMHSPADTTQLESFSLTQSTVSTGSDSSTPGAATASLFVFETPESPQPLNRSLTDPANLFLSPSRSSMPIAAAANRKIAGLYCLCIVGDHIWCGTNDCVVVLDRITLRVVDVMEAVPSPLAGISTAAQSIATTPVPSNLKPVSAPPLLGSSSPAPITSMLLAGSHVWTASARSGTVDIWDAHARVVRKSWSLESRGINALSLVNGKIWGGASNGSLYVWDADTHGLVKELVGHADAVRSLAAVPVSESSMFVLSGSASADGRLFVWDAGQV
ncbi:hypothetical protein CAOG_002394 [Capsaspora owczarzaki ATCC 30864]|uniref:UDENN domain-containing protein n=2 Tax=Capsaspora owczarzaki (strain ATCC 30864) TaxID=595528 RepID=A0A0D2WM94_CAPO3|nr:hypothetical protein CAOG_002394 [Capsaspora owczarzaki ATCC 30864]